MSTIKPRQIVPELIRIVDQLNDQRAKIEYELCGGDIIGQRRAWFDDRATVFTVREVRQVVTGDQAPDSALGSWAIFVGEQKIVADTERVPLWIAHPSLRGCGPAIEEFLRLTVPASNPS